MRVYIPSPLQSYTNDVAEVTASGSNLREVLGDLDRQFPGIRFRMIDEQDRIREHIRFFVDGKRANDLGAPVTEKADIQVLCALSGG